MLSKERYMAYADEKQRAEALLDDDCEVSDTVRGSTPDPPYVMRTTVIHGIDLAKRERNRLIAGKLLARCAEVDVDIALSPESVRGLLAARYVDGLNWDQVGSRFGLKPDAARMRVERWFDLERPQP